MASTATFALGSQLFVVPSGYQASSAGFLANTASLQSEAAAHETARSSLPGLSLLALGAGALGASASARTSKARTGRAAEERVGGKFSPAVQVGVTDPLGFFDPAGFSKEGDEAGFRNLRIAELKHGRVAMMAALGAVAQHFLVPSTAPGLPAGLSAATTPPGSYGFAALFLLSGALEFTLFKQEGNKEPGNFGDPAGLGDYSIDSRNRELNNGRFAMFAALGIISADLLTGKDAVQQFGS